MIWPRSAILHSAAASSVDGTSGLTLSIALRIATRTSFGAERVREVDRVLNDVDLRLQIRRDVDRRIGDDQRLVVARNVHDEAMTDAPGGAQAGIALDHGAHQLVGVQAALHQRFGSSLANQLDGFGCRILAVLSIDDLEAADVETVLGRDLANAVLRTDEDRLDQFQVGGRESAFERNLIAGVRDRDLYRRELLRASRRVRGTCRVCSVSCPGGGLKHGHLLPPWKSMDRLDHERVRRPIRICPDAASGLLGSPQPTVSIWMRPRWGLTLMVRTHADRIFLRMLTGGVWAARKMRRCPRLCLLSECRTWTRRPRLDESFALPELDYSEPADRLRSPHLHDAQRDGSRDRRRSAEERIPLWAQTPATPPLGDGDVDPNLQVIKNTKGPVMTLVDEFYKVGPGPSSSHTIGPMRITYDFYQRASKLPADQLAQATALQG